MPPVRIVVERLRFRSNQQATDRYIAGTVLESTYGELSSPVAAQCLLAHAPLLLWSLGCLEDESVYPLAIPFNSPAAGSKHIKYRPVYAGLYCLNW